MTSFPPNPTISNRVRLRYAPSPTGYLHVGGARTALYNFLYAKKYQGDFILRIEDTDLARSTDESLAMVISDLVWLGLDWAEGPEAQTLKDQGPYGPYRQSQRLDIYKKVANELINKGHAYYCFLTDAEIDLQKQKFGNDGHGFHIESPYKDWPIEKSLAKINAGETAVVRFRANQVQKDYLLQDIVRGEVKLPSDMIGDFVLLRSGGVPVYNFCCVVDDHLMKITHVLRAEEHLPNTLRQMMIYEALFWPMPHFGHLSLVLDEDRKKLSKRKGATSCTEFKNEGYLPEALKNYIALLGWSHPEEREILSQQEMINAFSLERFQSSGAVFDIKKLRWMNSQYLRAKNDVDLWQCLLPFLERNHLKLPTDSVWQQRSVQIFRPYIETLSEAVELYRPLSETGFVLQTEAQEVYAWESSEKVLQAWIAELRSAAAENISEAEFLLLQDRVKNETGAKGKFLFQCLRVAVIGKPQGAEIKILVPLLDRKVLIQRAQKTLQALADFTLKVVKP
jgi:nondiscriminating glutamyl-tRNA synthetase